MLVRKDFNAPCDHCDAPGPHGGVAAIVRGATGRWCEVMWICSDCIEHQELGPSPHIYDTPEQLIVALMRSPSWGENDWCDFDYNHDTLLRLLERPRSILSIREVSPNE